MHSSSHELAIAKACKIVPELHIPKDAQPEVKIRKLAVGLRKAKADVGQVAFKLNMNITELYLKLHPTNSPEV